MKGQELVTSWEAVGGWWWLHHDVGLQPCPRPLLSQTYTAVYYVLADLMMLTLYFHYKFKKRPSPCESGDHTGLGPAVLGKPETWVEAG